MKLFSSILKNILLITLIIFTISNNVFPYKKIINKKFFLQPIQIIKKKNKKKINNYSSWFTNYKNYKIGDHITIFFNEKNNIDNYIHKYIIKKSYNIYRLKLFFIKKINIYTRYINKTKKLLNKNNFSIQNNINLKLSVKVVSILKNKYLKILGEKKFFINNNIQKIRFYGVINPKKINLNNSIKSSEIYNFKIKYSHQNFKKNIFFYLKKIFFFKKIK
ncbi:Flagellar L-ring protein [Buchnera aphidicola (Cinara piceae)]|uniref:Flagellar L-ring protein n=1 Tax=Buchnera aphidicola (Cinara piceae) TaxID=1660043 RepID=A0A803FTZ7_9GAMM|nr:Flagellar L-ring protein [Buchnera aphidicola (Cinara piceae)]